jgi:RNA polymerase sigma factor (sigma-70 family)
MFVPTLVLTICLCAFPKNHNPLFQKKFMAKPAFPDEAALLAALQGGNEAERRRALQYFFANPRLLPWVLRHVQIQGGSVQDGKDVFEESFIVFERQVRTGHFRGESSLETWFHGIARWQWLAMRRKQRPTVDFDDVQPPSSELTPEKIMITEERRVILQALIAQVGERCQKLLGYFQLHYSMREISEVMGYASDQVAANQIHDCREKLKKIIHQQPENSDLLRHRPDA